MKTKLWFALILAPSLVLAAPAKKARRPAEAADAPVAVGLEPGLDLSELRRNGYTVAEEPQPEPSELPPPAERDALLEKAGFAREELRDFDELARDQLLLRAKHRSFSRLQQDYPALAPAKLDRLQKLLTR